MRNYFLNSDIIDHLDYRTGRSKHYQINQEQKDYRDYALSNDNVEVIEYYEDDYLITNNITSPILVDGPEDQ
jgi:hypothetical protein